MYLEREELRSIDTKEAGALSYHEFLEYLGSIRIFELQGMLASRIPIARRMAAQKFFFYHGRRGYVKIVDLMASTTMREMLQVREALEGGDVDGIAPTNWFSKQVREGHGRIQRLWPITIPLLYL